MKIRKPFVFFALLTSFFCSCASKKEFTLVLLPDTQIYSEKYPDIFKSQTKWVADHAKQITFMLHQGDITNNNSESQWKVATEAINLMDGKVPYTLALGNHDNGTNGRSDVRNTELFNRFFPYSKLCKLSTFGDAFEAGKMDNTWYQFKGGGYNWLIFSLEFGPRNSVLDWAAKVIAEHPKHKVIINTHAYLYSDDLRMGEVSTHKWLPKVYGIGKTGDTTAVNNGKQMWEKLVGKFPNILFVFSGHIIGDGTGFLVSEGEHGNKVYQMLANYQQGVIGSENGGNGYLRLITINTKMQTISVKSYSPYINKYKTEPDQQFLIENVKF